jgi:hypothetical protein
MIADTFNNYFLFVTENKNTKKKQIIMLTSVIFQPPHQFSIYHEVLQIPPQILKSNLFSTEEVVNIIKSLKSIYSHG